LSLAEIKNDINMNTLLFLNLGAGEIVLIALVVLLLFGGKKIPELMKGLGKGVRNFKDGLKDVEDQINSDADSNSDKK
jgi:sec-independent protein translocase protein TatA